MALASTGPAVAQEVQAVGLEYREVGTTTSESYLIALTLLNSGRPTRC
jgi:hypothetical protein